MSQPQMTPDEIAYWQQFDDDEVLMYQAWSTLDENSPVYFESRHKAIEWLKGVIRKHYGQDIGISNNATQYWAITPSSTIGFDVDGSVSEKPYIFIAGKRIAYSP